ncbi:Uncharacterised protein [Mycobacteroides abscessus subsp. abscessus]|nr:Uncharacterised protein [Mycobacteroides abscessus subsp. abscessus]SIN59356.1 Uncharacterised protein [Mycobacteroides abscessus subsp. abscessus]
MLYRAFLLRPNGSEGCDSTGASSLSSAAMASAYPPVKHMPMAPTPGPPLRSCSFCASARSQLITGEVFPVASTVNSRLTHPRNIEDAM